MFDKDGQDDKVIFNYQIDETKYYFLTGGSGYPLAEFIPPNIFLDGGAPAGMVVAEKRPKTANLAPDLLNHNL